MLVSDTHGNPVTASGPGPAVLLDDAVTAYLGFRKDTGDHRCLFLLELGASGARATLPRRSTGSATMKALRARAVERRNLSRRIRFGAQNGPSTDGSDYRQDEKGNET